MSDPNSVPTAPVPEPENYALSRDEELKLQQLQQLDFWRKQHTLEESPDGGPAGAEVHSLPAQWQLTLGIRLWDWQKECIDRWFTAQNRGVIKVVTGAGKTMLALAIAQELQHRQITNLRLAIVVPTVVLLEQWRDELSRRSNLPSKAIGLLGSGHDDRFDDTVRVLICVLNSAAKKLPEMVSKADIGQNLLLVVDECHRAGSAEMQRIFHTQRAASLGLSATPEREQETVPADDITEAMDDDPPDLSFEETILGKELGPVIFELNYASAIELGVLPPFSIVHYGLSLTPSESVKYERVSREIKDLRKELERPGRQGLGLIRWCRSRAAAGNLSAMRLVALTSERKRLLFRMEERAAAVLEIIRSAFKESPDTKAILFHESIDEVMRVFRLLRDAGYPVVAEHSEFSDQMRANALRLFRNGTARIIISARSLIEGFNVPSADLGIIMAASSSVRQRVQTLGRLLRKSTQAGSDKHAVLHVLYAANTVDELIYEKADWNQFVGADRNAYFLWPKVADGAPVPVPAAPRAPAPGEFDISEQSLHAGDTYPGNVDEGLGFSRDTQGNISVENGGYILPHPELSRILQHSKRAAGRFRITPKKWFVLELVKENESWRGVYLGRLNRPIEITGTIAGEETLPDTLTPGDHYPLSRAVGKSYSVLQRDPRLIAEKKTGQIRFVPPLESISDSGQRAAIAGIQTFLKSAYGRGHRLSKISVTKEGHVVYVHNNNAYFAGIAPLGADGFPIES